MSEVTKIQEIKKEQESIKIKFNNLHKSLLNQRLYAEADAISTIYHRTKYLSYVDGMEFIKELNKS